MLRLAIVGVGWAGARQAQAAREIPDQVQVTALVDNDPPFLEAQARELGIDRVYSDFDQALVGPDIDAVSICTPHALHAPMSIRALAAGKHVLVEKPMALTMDEATAMIEAAARYGRKLFVAENEPYSAMSRCLRGFLQAGTLGELTHVTLAAGFRAEDFGYAGRRSWLTEPARGGTGTWMLHGVHTVAQLRYILAPVAGEVRRVYAQEHKTPSYRRRELEGTVSGLLTFDRGLSLALLQSSETRLPGNLKGFVFHGEAGSLRASPAGAEHFTPEDGDTPRLLDYPEAPRSSYAEELAAFAAHVAGEPPDPERLPTTGESERRSLAVVQAGYESMATGLPIDLPARFPAAFASDSTAV